MRSWRCSHILDADDSRVTKKLYTWKSDSVRAPVQVKYFLRPRWGSCCTLRSRIQNGPSTDPSHTKQLSAGAGHTHNYYLPNVMAKSETYTLFLLARAARTNLICQIWYSVRRVLLLSVEIGQRQKSSVGYCNIIILSFIMGPNGVYLWN